MPRASHCGALLDGVPMSKFLKIDAVCQRYGGVDPATVYRLVRRNQFPAPRKFGSVSLWPVACLDAHDEHLPEGVNTRRTAAATAKCQTAEAIAKRHKTVIARRTAAKTEAATAKRRKGATAKCHAAATAGAA